MVLWSSPLIVIQDIVLTCYQLETKSIIYFLLLFTYPLGEIGSITMTIKDFYTEEFHATVQVNDLDRAKNFYTETLELTLKDDIPQAGWASVETKIAGAKIGLSIPQEGEPVASNVVNLHVSDTNKARETLTSKGLEVTDIVNLPGMISMFRVDDPDGNTLTFIGPPQ